MRKKDVMLRIDHSDYEQLKQIAQERRLSVSALIRTSIAKGLNARKDQ